VFDAVVQDTLTRGISVRFRADGTSMRPTIRHGEAITAAPVAPADIVCGDVLLFRSSGRLLAHRVVSVIEHGGVRALKIRGDAKLGCDALVETTDVIGRVISVDRGDRVIPLQGRIARLQHRMRAAVSLVRQLVWRRRQAVVDMLRFTQHDANGLDRPGHE
jgi:signal peptidase I